MFPVRGVPRLCENRIDMPDVGQPGAIRRFRQPDDIFPVRVSLIDIIPPIWRRLLLPQDVALRFGDSWDHLIVIEDELPVETVAGPLPRCVGGERACPPEDCGGTDGYGQLLQAIRDPHHPEHEEFVTWVGPAFEPEAFDLVRVTRILARYAPRLRSRPG